MTFVVLVYDSKNHETVSIMHHSADGPPILFEGKEAAELYIKELRRTGNFQIAGLELEHLVVELPDPVAPLSPAERTARE